MESRGRGRARGRARGSAQQQQQGPRPGPPRGIPQAAGQAPWGRPPHPQQIPSVQQVATPWVRPPVQPGPAPVGRGARQGAGTDAEVVERQRVLQGTGDGASGTQERGRGAGGNGGVRGRSNRNEIIHTKPQSIQSKKGTIGTSVELIANYFQLIQAGGWCLNQYRVDFNPDIDNTRQRKSLMHTAMQNIVTGFLFDGTVLYTPQRIHPDPLEVFVKTNNDENIRITVRLVGDVAWGDFHYIQLFNIIIRKCLAFMQLHLVGRDYYDPSAQITIPDHRMQLWPGYYTSMRQHEKNILLNCDVTFKVMRMDNVYDMLLECRGPNSRKEFQSKIIGSVVLTYYNNKTYKIDDVDFNSSPESVFPKRDGTVTSFIDYYKEKHNVNIQVRAQPLLVSRSKPREIRAGMAETVLLIPELCQLTGLTDRQRENFHLMRALADHTRVGPPERIQKLLGFSQRMKSSPDVMQELRKWDLNVADSLIKFSGRVMQSEKIIGGGTDTKYSAGDQADWTRSLRMFPMYTNGQLQTFVIICPTKFRGQCQDFVVSLQKAARGMSWHIGQPKIFDISDDRSSTYLDAMEHVISKYDPTLIMCVVPNNSLDRYGAIKKKGCVDRGVPTQIILAKTLSSKGVLSIATKVAIQLNCKIGGAPWTINIPLSNLMIVGYDVCRDTANKGKSFGAMVASLDKSVSRYFNYVCEHQYEEELSNNFAAFLLLACQKFKEVNGNHPDRILIYRDGVGDGQLPYVYEHEVVNIKKRLTDEIYTSNNLKLAFIVVSKRIKTRIFTNTGNNPLPGTVVDDVITLPERYDFYLVSQCVRQGTVAPTNYNIIEDTMGLPAEKLQILTYKLCHMYYNWSGTVRVPAPCQYAHKLAFLVAQALHRPHHRSLENVLYYL